MIAVAEPGRARSRSWPPCLRVSVANLSLADSGLLRLHVIAEQDVLIAEVQFALRDDGMRPAIQLRAVGLVEAAGFLVAFRAGLDQGDSTGAVLAPQVEVAVGVGD